MRIAKRRQSGISMLEVMITMSLVMLGLLVVMTSFVAISKASRYGQRMITATTVARLEMERVRNTSYANLQNVTGAYGEYTDYPDYRHQVQITDHGTTKEIVLQVYFEHDRRRVEMRTWVANL